MLNSSLRDYNDAYIFVKEIITNTEGAAAANEAVKWLEKSNNKVITQNCVPFTGWVSEITNTQVDNAKNLNVVMPMYNLTGYSDNHSKTSGSLW